jgi:hypothetical protein
MKSALVGHTGFVGGTLLRQRSFDDLYNSRNVEALAGKTYDLVACAAAPGVKWKANQEPEQDLASIRRLRRLRSIAPPAARTAATASCSRTSSPRASRRSWSVSPASSATA